MPVEQVSPELERIVSPDQDLEELGRGYHGPGVNAEGPMWWKEGGYLLFSHVGNNQRLKWAPGEGVTVFQQATNNANGTTRDPQGRLVACESGARRVTRLEADGSVTIVADAYEGNPFNRPNDLAVKSDGSTYFTDPGAAGGPVEMGFAGVYRVPPNLGTVTLVTRDIAFPNGITFSTDEKVLYVDDSRNATIRAFDVQSDGTLTNDRVFFRFISDLPGVADGIKVDVEGNVYCTGPGGLWIIDPSGKHLGTILTGAQQTTNCAWGDDDWKTMFITTRDTLVRIRLKIPGVQVPR